MQRRRVRLVVALLSAAIAYRLRWWFQPECQARIALVLKTLNSRFSSKCNRAPTKPPRPLDVDLVVQAAEREIDVERQMQIVENLVQSRLNALAVTPCGSHEVIPAIAEPTTRDPRHHRRYTVDSGRRQRSEHPDGELVGWTTTGVDGDTGSTWYGIGGRRRCAILEGIPGHDTGDPRLRGFKERSRAPGVSISRRRRRTGSATRASRCSRTCCRRIRISTRCSPATT